MSDSSFLSKCENEQNKEKDSQELTDAQLANLTRRQRMALMAKKAQKTGQDVPVESLEYTAK